MVNTATTAALGMAFWVLAGRFFTTAQVGENAALVSGMMLLSVVSQLNLAMGISRLLPQVEQRRWRPVVGAYGLTSLVAVLTTGTLVTLAPRLSDGFGFLRQTPTLKAGLVVAVALWNIFALQDAVLTSARWAAAVPVENGLFGVLKIVLMVGFAHSALAVHGIFLAWLLAMAALVVPVSGLLFGKVLRASGRQPRQEPATLRVADRRRVVRYLAVDYAASLFFQGYTALLPLVVLGVLGAVANAYFYVAFVIAVAVGSLAQSLGTALVVEGAHAETELGSLARRSVRRYCTFVLPAVAALVAGAGLLLAPFGATYAAHASTLLRLLLVGTVPQAVVMLYLSVERIKARATRVLAVEAGLAFLVIAGGIIGMSRFGLVGIGTAWLLAQSAMAAVVIPQLREVLVGAAQHLQAEPNDGCRAVPRIA